MKRVIPFLALMIIILSVGMASAQPWTCSIDVSICGLGEYQLLYPDHHIELWAQSDPRFAPEFRLELPDMTPEIDTGPYQVNNTQCSGFSARIEPQFGLFNEREYRIMIVDFDRPGLIDPRDPYIIPAFDKGYRNCLTSPVMDMNWPTCDCSKVPDLPISGIDTGGLIDNNGSVKSTQPNTESTWGVLKSSYR